jgi:protein-histidine pros-kinase
MIRSALLRMQLQDALGVSSADAAIARVAQLVAAEPALAQIFQAVDATYARFGSLQQVAVEVGGLVVSEWDLKSGRIESGKAWKSLLGYAPDDVPDTVSAWRALVHPEDLKALSAAIGAHIRESSRKFALDCRCRTPDANWRWLRISGRAAARDAHGEPTRLVVVQQDIDAERQLEASLNAARESAETAGRSRTAFLANMSHEIRTPMNAILGMTELALDTNLDAEQRHYLATVRSSCEALLAIVNDILDFSKIEAGKLQVEKIDFELSAIVFEAVRSLAVGAQQKGLDVTVEIAPGLPARVWGDPVRLRQVITNLVGNAIKFTAAGEVAVAVRLQQAAADRITAIFEVRDTGIGIPADKQRQIFEAFSQADVSTTRRFGGTGLGLAISSRLVELMGGALKVVSEEGRGSVFGFALPLGVEQGAPPSRALAPALAGQRALLIGAAGGSMRLLEGMFGRWGMQPALVSSMTEARAAAEQWRQAGFPFALVVCDAAAALAEDGATLTEWLAKKPVEPMISLITVAGQRDQLPLLRALGLSVYVVKPVASDDMLDAVALAVGNASGTLQLDNFDVEASLRVENAVDGRLNILLVEDNPVNQELAQRLLEKAGHKVTLASNGEEAVNCFEEAHFDVVLMDMQMPVMDGIEATQAIRARELRRSWVASATDFHQLPIIAMTANAMAGDRDRCLQAGMNDYVAKPIRQAELFAALDRATRGGSASVHAALPVVQRNSGSMDADAALRDLGDAELVREMARMLLAQWDSHIRAIVDALSARDEPSLCRAAHTFKGLLAMFHAENARRHALAIELAAKDGKWSEATEALAALHLALDLVRPELEVFSAGT